jgi:hypothetical protein
MLTITPDVARSLASVVSQLVPVLGLSLIFTERRLLAMAAPSQTATGPAIQTHGGDKPAQDNTEPAVTGAPMSKGASWSSRFLDYFRELSNPRFLAYLVEFVTFIHAILYSLWVTANPTAKWGPIGYLNVMLANTAVFVIIVMYRMTGFMFGGPSVRTRIWQRIILLVVIAAASNVLWTMTFGLRVAVA